jgi:outer membrane protein FlgP
MLNIAKTISVVVLATALLNGCSTIYDKHVQWQTVQPEAFPVLHAIGYAPISLQKSAHQTQKMLMAIDASKLAAYAELAEQVYGQQINSSTKMSDLIIGNKQLNATVQGVIRGAKIIKSYPVGDTYATELELDMKDVFDIYQATARKSEVKGIQYY